MIARGPSEASPVQHAQHAVKLAAFPAAGWQAKLSVRCPGEERPGNRKAENNQQQDEEQSHNS
jgi:hypothetical protein